MYSGQQSLTESMMCKSYVVLCIFSAFFHFHICVGHACAGLRLMLVIILHQFSTLFTESGTFNQTQSLLIQLFLQDSLHWGALFTSSEAGIVGWLPCPPGIYMGSGNPNSHPEPCPTKYFSYWAISQAPILALLDSTF